MYSISVPSGLSKKVYKFSSAAGLLGGSRAIKRPSVSGPAHDTAMDHDIPTDIWIFYCARRLKMHWRTVDPVQLEELAADLAREPQLRQLSPQAAAAQWLEPILTSRE
jgi:hypothetical protein